MWVILIFFLCSFAYLCFVVDKYINKYFGGENEEDEEANNKSYGNSIVTQLFFCANICERR